MPWRGFALYRMEARLRIMSEASVYETRGLLIFDLADEVAGQWGKYGLSVIAGRLTGRRLPIKRSRRFVVAGAGCTDKQLHPCPVPGHGLSLSKMTQCRQSEI